MKNNIYLDNCSTTPLSKYVKTEMIAAMNEDYKNPSSLHRLGITSEKAMEKALKSVSTLMNAMPNKVFFTSGGTESNNMAIFQVAKARKRNVKIALTMADHPSITETVKAYGIETYILPIDRFGVIKLEEIELPEHLDMIIITHVHNEIGSIQPMYEICKAVRKKYPTTHIHADCVQSYGKFKLHPEDWDIDTMSVSSHKIHGPKGIGAIYIKNPNKTSPFIVGGLQQRGLRGGTENILGIVGFGAAAEERLQYLESNLEKVALLKRTFMNILEDADIEYHVNSSENGTPYILSLSIPNAKGEVILHMMEERGIYISTSSACSSKSSHARKPLDVMGISRDRIEGTIRICFNEQLTEKEVTIAATELVKCIRTYNQWMGR
ncbi:MAG: cysteine desulfurase [Tissierellia bacterium]|nr:cysteine desulfurase [Tissierellia bacterium]